MFLIQKEKIFFEDINKFQTELKDQIKFRKHIGSLLAKQFIEIGNILVYIIYKLTLE